ncbi:MAG: NAD(P)/FAD-dependent oxidoreductase [Myxococcota bacterium]|jgi:prolycopene isomerase|nr:NAD(P)/FAD-dependent oxidoreductase [Myxococcota bacterium]
MGDERYDVIVIGSGPGGLSAAALLQKRGFDCLLVEKNELLGGKMVSIEKDGYAYDLFPHGQVPMRGSAFETVFEELGVSDEFVPAIEPSDPRDILTMLYRRGDKQEYSRTTQGQAMADPGPFFKVWDLTPEEEEAVVNVMAEMTLMPEEQVHALDDVTMKEWLDERDVPGPLYNYLGFHANASLAEPIDLVAASEQITIMQQVMLQGGGGQYEGGFGTLAKVMAREFEKHGGTLLTGCRVERISIEDGAVTGIKTSDGRFEAPVVVSSAGIQPTILKLCGEQHFDKTYVNYIKGLVPGWAFTSIRYFLDEPVMETGIYIMYSDDSWLDTARFERVKNGETPEEVILFMVNHSFFDEHAAPPGKQVLVSGTVCSSNPEAREIEAIWKRMDEQMKEHFPEIWEICERREYSGPKEIAALTRDSVLPGQGGECVGLAQIVGQCGKHKPDSNAPINGLYIAGADAGAKGMGTHQSALSGIAVAKMAQRYLLGRSKMR